MVGLQSLNPLVGPGGVKRVYTTKLNRGATPAVLIQNPVVPFFDPINHDFSNSSAVADCQSGASFSGGWTALHAAAEATEAGPHGNRRSVKGDLESMRFLLHGRGHHVPPEISFPHVSSPQIDVNASMTKSKYTPLHIAVRAGHEEALALLLQNSALFDAQDCLGRTPIHLAAELGHSNCLAALLDGGSGRTSGTLTLRIFAANIQALQDETHNMGLEVWAEVSVDQQPPIKYTPQKTSVQVDTLTPTWNNVELNFRCCQLDAKATVKLMYRHSKMSKKEKDLVVGIFTCQVHTALEVMKEMGDEPFSVPLESPAKLKEREQRAAAEASTALASSQTNSVAVSERVPPGSSAHGAMPSGGGSRRVSRAPSQEDANPKGEKPKRRVTLRGAADRVLYVNRFRRPRSRSSEEPDEEDDSEGTGNTVRMAAHFRPVINIVDTTGKSALMLCGLSGSLDCAEALLRAHADANLVDVFGSTAASLAAGKGHDDVCRRIEMSGGQ